jgi:hypothetical protein
MNLNDLCHVKDAGPLTGYAPKSLAQYAFLCPDFPAVAVTVGTSKLYRKADLAAWAKKRRERTKHKAA